MAVRWLFDLLTEDVRRCTRCRGSGRSPTAVNKFCKECYGSGLAGDDILLRLDGRVERVCVHGVGHTVCCLVTRYPTFVHGCCGAGCCAEYARKETE